MWTLTPAEYAETVAKIAKINERAVKKGFTGRLEVTGTEVQKETRMGGPYGIRVKYTVVETEITGEAPSYNGWKFIATLDWDENANGLIVRTAPGVESVNRESLREGFCAHCNTKRVRRLTYLLLNAEGEQMQVGRSCIKDFIGWVGFPVFLDVEGVEKEVDEFLGSFGGGADRAYSVETVLAVAWAAIKTHGFVSSQDWDRPSTRSTVEEFLSGRGKYADEVRDALQPLLAECEERATEIRNFLLSEEWSGDSEYVLNMKTILAADYVSSRNMGLIVSAPQAHAKAQERTLIRQKAKTIEAYIGEVGEKITISGTITNINWIDTQYGTSTLYTITTEAGTVKWFASRPALGDKQGVEVKIAATVKKHEDYQGHLSTLVTRAKAL